MINTNPQVLILDASSISGRSASFNSYSKQFILGPLGEYFLSQNVTPTVKTASDMTIEEVKEAVNTVDAVLLPGGEDVHPAFYDGPWNYPGGGLHTAKGDLIQMEAVRHAALANKKVFGICRGLQVINVALGGTLIQDFNGHKNTNYKQLRDRFAVTEINTTHPILSQMEDVRCSHHQSIKELGRGLTATAHAHDGIIEAVDHEGGNIMAVQFHPEAEATFNNQIPAVVDWMFS